ncbi:MAG: hypothetical protein ACK40O_05755 [Allosphingosinicella sp.]
MSQPWSPSTPPGLADAGAQVAQLRRVLALVEELAGERGGDCALDEAARTRAGYEDALPVDQRRFDRCAARAIAAAAAGAEALLAGDGDSAGRKAAAARLADALREALAELAEIVRA